jgi:hypothetical protein
MISFIFCTLYALFFGGLVAYLNEANGNPAKLTLRGKRVVFATAIIIGFILCYITFHFQINCDLRAGATTACSIAWL